MIWVMQASELQDPEVIALMEVIRRTLLFIVRWIERRYGLTESSR